MEGVFCGDDFLVVGCGVGEFYCCFVGFGVGVIELDV